MESNKQSDLETGGLLSATEDEDDKVNLPLPRLLGVRHLTAKRRCLAGALFVIWLIILLVLILNGRKSSDTTGEGGADDVSGRVEAEKPSGGGRVDDDIVDTPEPESSENQSDGKSQPLPARSYLEDKSEYLHNLSCIPKVCTDTKHFIGSAKPLADHRGFTLLASFPGSGNTWTRSISK